MIKQRNVPMRYILLLFMTVELSVKIDPFFKESPVQTAEMSLKALQINDLLGFSFWVVINYQLFRKFLKKLVIFWA